ncbi:MAG: tagaturonate epimerase family protein [Anaerolineae bacterium]
MSLALKQLAEINLPIYSNSLADAGDATFFLAWTERGKRLGVVAPATSPAVAAFVGEHSSQDDKKLLICPLTHQNAAALRAWLPWLRPRPLGLQTSVGCGDRLGLATPGHVRAALAVPGLAMVFAQQSVRELSRTGRTPEEVLDAATWGMFQEGWRAGAGADADHLKSPADIDAYLAAGYTFFTLDPGAFVDSAADTDDEATVRAKYAALPWPDLATTARDLRAAYLGKRIEVEDRAFSLDEAVFLRAAVKYGRAVAHAAMLYRHLASRCPAGSFELEVSVDETATPTSHAEHLFIARELRRLGVRWVSLAPRYVGRFEKGVDYIGDLAALEADFAGHAAIARALGPYKLSLHTGSDKFSLYAIAARQTRGQLHLKTAGTSYLEALRALAGFDPALFREILAFAARHYETDRASYHVSADPARLPALDSLGDADLPGLLDDFDVRQVLHVTFGSVLTSSRGFKERLLAGLAAHEEAYYAALEQHFVRHFTPIVQGG